MLFATNGVMIMRQSRNVSLTPELETFITEAMESGDYANASEVVRAGLRSLRGDRLEPAPRIALVGGGECGDIIRKRDWSETPVGSIESWSVGLRTTVANIINSPVAKVLMWGPKHIMFYNDSYRDIAGVKHPAALGGEVAVIWSEIWDWNRDMIEAGMRGELRSFRNQPMALDQGDTIRHFVFDLFYTPVYDADGTVGGVMCTVVDNTARTALEAQLAASEAELRTVTDALPMLVAYVDRSHTYRFVNQAYEDWFGWKRSEIVGLHARDVVGEALYQERLPSVERAFSGETFSSQTDLRHPDGTIRKVEFRYVPRVDPDGSIPGLYVLGVDVSERAQREAELAVSNARFRRAMDAMHGVLWTNDASGRMTGEQPGWAALTGQSPEEYQGYGWASAVHPEDRDASVTSWLAAVKAKGMYVNEHRVRRHDGEWREFAIRALPVLDGDGEIAEWVGVHTDITHQRAAEQALRDHAEDLARQVRHRERAETQLRQLSENLEARVVAEIAERQRAEAKLAQAQKMETIGKLTGGVAHDFNNLLQVISGNLQLLSRDIAGNARAENRVSNAMAGVSRGVKLASQLLAFGRRQALEPKVVNVSRFVRDMDDMIRRAIGEGVEIETIFAGGLWNTFIDPTQIENALLNLAINARDAMDGYGRLTIELANAQLDEQYARIHDDVEPGQYVMLAVSDTGCGMPPDLLEKVFEPFFSTKAEGKGSGLGLSMVYGFVKQSGGHVKIYSEVGHGTTVKLYLPRALGTEDIEVNVEAGPSSGGTETILVVEDDAEVREIVIAMVADLGYRVLKAVDAASALTVIDSGVPIDILFTDVVMPGPLKSPELARKARERLPNIAVLFTSGYTENSIVHGGKLDPGVALLSKPYSREALARKLRHVLANQAQRRLMDAAPPLPASAPTSPSPGPIMDTCTILLVEDDFLIRVNMSDMLANAGFSVVEAANVEDALAVLAETPVDVLLTDVNLSGRSGQELVDVARAGRPGLAVIYATGDAASVRPVPHAVILTKPFDERQLLQAVARAREAMASAGEADPA